MREGDISSHSGEGALLRSRELLRQARQALDGFIASRSKPPQESGARIQARPTNEQLATVFSGSSDLASRVQAIENAPEAFVNALIDQYRRRTTPAHLRPIWRADWDASGSTPEQMIYTSWWGSPRLYEREIFIWRDMDRDTEMSLQRETVCYHWRYDHGEDGGGASTYIEMTVNAEGNVELSSAPPYSYYPATPDGFTALLEECLR
ncbi:hypothetical protein [Streptomyces sp. NRRL S-813]|uniref:hypothetical protein n=1 Tax=Streptomyces sp. NRRL S-813 TaxID=1463919 RepID=UPI0004C2852B|nr:hypothetical protein [Streptomyces sp. NRRL S-813]